MSTQLPPPQPSAPPVRLSRVARELRNEHNGVHTSTPPNPGGFPQGFATSPATREQQRQLHGGARAYDRSPAGAGWAQRVEDARYVAHARSPAVGVRAGGAAPVEGSGGMPAPYVRSPASRSAPVLPDQPTSWQKYPPSQTSHPELQGVPQHHAPYPVQRHQWGNAQRPPVQPTHNSQPHHPVQMTSQPALQRAQTAPVHAANSRGSSLDSLGRAHSVAHEEYAPPPGYPGTQPPGYATYSGYPPLYPGYATQHLSYAPQYPGCPPGYPAQLPTYGQVVAPPSAANPLDPAYISARRREEPRGMAPVREKLFQEHMGQFAPKTAVPAANPLDPEALVAREVAEDAARPVRRRSTVAMENMHSLAPPPKEAYPISPEEQLRRRDTYRAQAGPSAGISRAVRDGLRRAQTMAVEEKEDNVEPASNELRRRATAPVGQVASYKAKEKPAWAREGVNGIPKLSPATKNFDKTVWGKYAPSKRRYRAVIVGVTYANTKQNTLHGSLSDVQNVFRLLVDTFGFAKENIRVLCDTIPGCGEVGVEMPTYKNIMESMKWIRTDAQDGDSMFFYFAGHGSLVKDYSGDEQDTEYDQCLVPVDSAQSGVIVDDDIFSWLIRRVPFGARLTCLIDACTSGTVCDLPFLHTRKRGHRRAKLGTEMDTSSNAQPPRALRPDMRVGETLLYAGSADLQQAVDITRVRMGTVISFGVMTKSFIESVRELLKRQREGKGTAETSFGAHLRLIQSTVDAITKEEETLKGTSPQEPQLSSSHMFHINETQFSL